MDIYEIGIVQCVKDFINFIKFKKQIKEEFKRRDSLFNKLNLKKNWLGNVVYLQLNCSDEDLMNFNYDEESMVMGKLKPVINYLSSDLNWGDYLQMQVSNFVDEDGNKSLSYAILFVFSGYRLTPARFILMTLVTLALLGTGIWAICHFLV